MDIFALLREKSARLYLERDFSFARHTTIGCGGTASVAAYPESAEEACGLMRLLRREGIPYCYLGAGANVLPQEGRFEGVVVRFSRMADVAFGGETLTAGSGATGGKLIRAACEKGLSGLEFFTGIPMTLGGAAAMNAGVPNRHFADAVSSVTCTDGETIRTLLQSACKFGEKDSIFLQENLAVVSATFRLTRAPRTEIEAKRKAYAARRKDLPSGRSMGCVFVNPAGRSAGAIIDACGLKGISVGGARISRTHANFIINDHATASEISELIRTVKLRVYESTGILLREEIRRLPAEWGN